ncbi:phosphopantetheine-binding protein [Streptomyces sp. NPDC090306]|uniref:phosphopantetheine-binding protein n=1 Tax=Streptomyces sp. NPDC090306 TaxID=3365961 RepID=UPI003802E810
MSEPRLPSPEPPFGVPTTPLARAVADAYREVLGIDGIEPDDDFFDLGGDSLTAARLAALLHDRLGHDLSPADVFDLPTISALTHELERRRADA